MRDEIPSFFFLISNVFKLLFTTDPKISDYIAGVILFQETLYQKDENGRLLIEHLKERCIIPGIKVDTGLVNLFCSENEVATQGEPAYFFFL